jgi:hypothetical protein
MSEKWAELELRLRRMLDSLSVLPNVQLHWDDLPKTGLGDVAFWLSNKLEGAAQDKAGLEQQIRKYCLFGELFELEKEWMHDHVNSILLRSAYLEFVLLADKLPETKTFLTL